MDPLNPVDIVVLAGMIVRSPGGQPFTQLRLSEELGLSPATTFRAVRRLDGAGLWDQAHFQVNRSGAAELLIHGVRWVFPATPGPLARGVPTAHAGPALRDSFVSDQPYVWPSAEGHATGPSVQPLHPCAPNLMETCPDAYDILTLVDAIRVGRARERHAAAHLLRTRLGVA